MNISKVSSATAPTADITNSKLLNWAVVQEFASSNIKCAVSALRTHACPHLASP